MPRGDEISGLIRLSEDQAARLMIMYGEAEREILQELNRALLTPDEKRYLQTMLRNVRAILQDLGDGSRTWCEEAIPEVYMQGGLFADQQVRRMGEKVLVGFGAIHQQAVQVLAENAFNRFSDVTQFIGRRVDDIYRTMALEAVRGTVAGYQTWQQVADRFRERLAEQGVTGFTDAAGRQWNMTRYAEMVARTTTMEAHLQGTANRLLEYGHDLVKVSTHSRPCEMCEPWQGRVLSLTGKTEGYPTLDEARARGLFHPNCRHAYGLWLPELAEE